MAPGRPARGASAALLTLLALGAAACRSKGAGADPDRRAVLELASDTIQLERGVALVDVLVRSNASLHPDTARVRQGDVVRFVTGDARPHAIAFEADRLTPESVAFLERTDQLRGPPLIIEGASWVISLADAPPGIYSFVDLSQDARGAIVVSPAEPKRN
jgi:plastocyanin